MSAIVTPGTSLRADAARNRTLVLEAASELLRERGLDVTMQEIADAAGVGVGTVCRRFATKQELVAALVQERMEMLLEIVRSGVDELENDPWGAFSRAFVDAVQLHVRDRGFMETVGCEHAGHQRHQELRHDLMVLLRVLVRRGIELGALREDVVAEDIPELACMVSRTSCSPMGELEPESWRRACTIVLDGLRAADTRDPHESLDPSLPSYEQLVARSVEA
jgi:AcrR family transcriptional regulator